MQHHKYKSAIEAWYQSLAPYAHVVIAPNYPARAFTSMTGADASLKRLAREIALHLDHRYFGTRRMLRDISAADRFDAICWPEKLVGNPHLHCAFFLNPEAVERLGTIERKTQENDRLAFLLSSLRTVDVTPSDEDQELMRLHPKQRDERLQRHFRKLAPGATCSVTGVYDAAGLARYTGKEYNNSRAEEGSGFFFLSGFHSSPQHRARSGGVL